MNESQNPEVSMNYHFSIFRFAHLKVKTFFEEASAEITDAVNTHVSVANKWLNETSEVILDFMHHHTIVCKSSFRI